MTPTFNSNAGFTRRTISDVELNILCELGYQTNICNGCYAFAQPEPDLVNTNIEAYQACCYTEYVAKVGQPLLIEKTDLLCNDFTNGNGIDLEVTELTIYNNPSYLVTETATGFEIIADQAGTYIVRYTIAGCDCFLNSSMFIILVSEDLPTCPLVTCNDLVCYNTFEDINIVQNRFF